MIIQASIPGGYAGVVAASYVPVAPTNIGLRFSLKFANSRSLKFFRKRNGIGVGNDMVS